MPERLYTTSPGGPPVTPKPQPNPSALPHIAPGEKGVAIASANGRPLNQTFQRAMLFLCFRSRKTANKRIGSQVSRRLPPHNAENVPTIKLAIEQTDQSSKATASTAFEKPEDILNLHEPPQMTSAGSII